VHQPTAQKWMVPQRCWKAFSRAYTQHNGNRHRNAKTPREGATPAGTHQWWSRLGRKAKCPCQWHCNAIGTQSKANTQHQCAHRFAWIPFKRRHRVPHNPAASLVYQSHADANSAKRDTHLFRKFVCLRNSQYLMVGLCK